MNSRVSARSRLDLALSNTLPPATGQLLTAHGFGVPMFSVFGFVWFFFPLFAVFRLVLFDLFALFWFGFVWCYSLRFFFVMVCWIFGCFFCSVLFGFLVSPQ